MQYQRPAPKHDIVFSIPLHTKRLNKRFWVTDYSSKTFMQFAKQKVGKSCYFRIMFAHPNGGQWLIPIPICFMDEFVKLRKSFGPMRYMSVTEKKRFQLGIKPIFYELTGEKRKVFKGDGSNSYNRYNSYSNSIPNKSNSSNCGEEMSIKLVNFNGACPEQEWIKLRKKYPGMSITDILNLIIEKENAEKPPLAQTK